MRKMVFVLVVAALFITTSAYAERPLCGCYCGWKALPSCSDDTCKQACGWVDPSSNSGQGQTGWIQQWLEQRKAKKEQKLNAQRHRAQEQRDRLSAEAETAAAAADTQQSTWEEKKEQLMLGFKMPESEPVPGPNASLADVSASTECSAGFTDTSVVDLCGLESQDPASMSDERALIIGRLTEPNPWGASITRSLKIAEPPLPYKGFNELQPGDVLLVFPEEGFWSDVRGHLIRTGDRVSSPGSGSQADHTLIFVKEVNGTRFFLDNRLGEGSRIKTQEEVLEEYGSLNMDVASPAELGVAQPLSSAEAEKLWHAAWERGIGELQAMPERSRNVVDKTSYGLYGDDNMVCSETSRWVLIKAGRTAPDSGSPLKKLLGVYFGPANFYSQEQYFLVSPLRRNQN